MKLLQMFYGLSLSLLVAACGGGGGGGDGSNGGNTSQSATSVLCNDLTGLEAIYFDFFNGTIRVDLPSTAFTIPFAVNTTQPSYTNSISPLLGFIVPQGWSAADGTDVSGFAFPGATSAANLLRNDNKAVWRYVISSQLDPNSGYSSVSIRDAEINTALNFLGNPAVTSEECDIVVPPQANIIGFESASAKVVRAGGFTIMVRAHITIPNGLGGVGFYDGYLSMAPTAEHTTLINDIFIPMITQLYGGGSAPAQCEDGLDNDGDGQIDLNDAQCVGPEDDNEAT